MRKKILEPIRLKGRVADACFQQGKAVAFSLFVDVVEHLYCQLLNSGTPVAAQENVINVAAVYIAEVRNNPPFKNILGQTLIELTPYKTGDFTSSPYIPDSLMKMMVQRKNLINGIKVIKDNKCGSGAYMLSLMATLYSEFGEAELLEWSVSGVDADLLCTKIAAIQVLVNLAVHNTGPGGLTITHKPFDSKMHEYLMLKLSYNKLSKQYEIMNKNMAWVSSAQAVLFA